MEELNQQDECILRFAKSNGFLNPLWVLPQSDSQHIEHSFHRLNDFLMRALEVGKLERVDSFEVNQFMTKLRLRLAKMGWMGIAPLLLARPSSSQLTSTQTEPALTESQRSRSAHENSRMSRLKTSSLHAKLMKAKRRPLTS